MVVVGVAFKDVCVAFLIEHDDRLDARAERQRLVLVGNGRVDVGERGVLAVDDTLIVCPQCFMKGASLPS